MKNSKRNTNGSVGKEISLAREYRSETIIYNSCFHTLWSTPWTTVTLKKSCRIPECGRVAIAAICLRTDRVITHKGNHVRRSSRRDSSARPSACEWQPCDLTLTEYKNKSRPARQPNSCFLEISHACFETTVLDMCSMKLTSLNNRGIPWIILYHSAFTTRKR